MVQLDRLTYHWNSPSLLHQYVTVNGMMSAWVTEVHVIKLKCVAYKNQKKTNKVDFCKLTPVVTYCLDMCLTTSRLSWKQGGQK